MWYEDCTFREYLEQVIPPDTPEELHVPALARAQRSLPVLVRAFQDALDAGRFGEQVVMLPYVIVVLALLFLIVLWNRW